MGLFSAPKFMVTLNPANSIIEEMKPEVNSLQKGQYGEVIFNDEFFTQFPSTDHFLQPASDVRVPNNAGFVNEPSNLLLGWYKPMQSLGNIILHKKNLRTFYWSLIAELRTDFPYLYPLDLECALHLVVKKTDYHERFHFQSDVLRQMFHGKLDWEKFDWEKEEALAVAYSRIKLLKEYGNPTVGGMNRAFHERIFNRAFAFKSAGYCDWPRYADEIRFKSAWLDYLSPPNYHDLQKNGVNNLQDLMFGLLGEVTGGCCMMVAKY